MTDDEVRAIVETAHAAGQPVVAHAHREDEIRVGLKHGVDCFEHTGLATEPGYPEDILAAHPQAQSARSTGARPSRGCSSPTTPRDVFPEPARRSALAADLPRDIVDDIRQSLRNSPAFRYFTLDLPAPSDAGQEVPAAARHRRHHDGRHGQRDPGQFPHRLDLAGARHLGAPRRDADAGDRGSHALAGVWLKGRRTSGTLAPGRFADVIAVNGDVLTHVDLLQRVDVVVKNGVRVR